MGSENGKEEIIELTEVLEEGPAFAGRKDGPEPLPPAPENKRTPLRPEGAGDSLAGLPDPAAGLMKEVWTRQAESWMAREGPRIVERLAADLTRRLVTERLSSELEKLKAETEALRARGEAFSQKLDGWFSSEGLKSLEQKAREAVPQVAAEAIQAEMGILKKEIEEFQARIEDLNGRAQTWFASEGNRVLEKVAREIFPQTAERVLRQEIERLREGSPESEKE